MYTPRILLIQADEDTHRGLRRRLERRGCEVLEAKSQFDAVRMAWESGPDLVIQENPVRFPDRVDAFDDVLEAVELLAGPLPCDRRTLLPRAHRPRALLVLAVTR